MLFRVNERNPVARIQSPTIMPEQAHVCSPQSSESTSMLRVPWKHAYKPTNIKKQQDVSNSLDLSLLIIFGFVFLRPPRKLRHSCRNTGNDFTLVDFKRAVMCLR